MRARDIAAGPAYLVRFRHVELELLIVLLAQPFDHVHRPRSQGLPNGIEENCSDSESF